MTVAEILEPVVSATLGSVVPVRIDGWDGSSTGPSDAPLGVRFASRRGLRRLVWTSWLTQRGAGRPSREGHRRGRRAISHHYDVGNDFYELVLGPSMVYSCAYFEQPPSTAYTLLCRPDARDGVVRRVGHLAVVLHPDLDILGQPRGGHPAPRILGLLVGERDADRSDSVVLCGVDDEPPPSRSRRRARACRAAARACEGRRETCGASAPRTSTATSSPTESSSRCRRWWRSSRTPAWRLVTSSRCVSTTP